MINRGYVVPVSPELMARMEAAATKAQTTGEYVVLWDGTPNRPWGSYISVETEEQHQRRQKPLRSAHQLSAEEVQDLILMALETPLDVIAMWYHVHPDTVEYIVNGFTASVRGPR